jgi:hypothetical protein
MATLGWSGGRGWPDRSPGPARTACGRRPGPKPAEHGAEVVVAELAARIRGRYHSACLAGTGRMGTVTGTWHSVSWLGRRSACGATSRMHHIDLQTLSALRGPTQLKAPHVPAFCGRCGGQVLLGCRSCDAGIAGQMDGRPRDPQWEPAGFCWKCGFPYPWATREQRLAQLYNVIDDEELDDAERLAVVEQIAVLSEPVDEVSDEDRVRAGERVKSLAPKAWEAALPILQSLLTAKAKQDLGLPP